MRFDNYVRFFLVSVPTNPTGKEKPLQLCTVKHIVRDPSVTQTANILNDRKQGDLFVLKARRYQQFLFMWFFLLQIYSFLNTNLRSSWSFSYFFVQTNFKTLLLNNFYFFVYPFAFLCVTPVQSKYACISWNNPPCWQTT